MKFLLSLVLLFTIFTARAQQFSQYNTATLFDSFENPAQRAFIPDSSRQFASNFFLPNFNVNGSVVGNGQNSLRSLISKGNYNITGLTQNLHKISDLNLNLNNYWFMLKLYRRLDSNQEIGISAQTKAEGRGSITDETLLLLDSYKNLENGMDNNNLFNSSFQAQAYHQLSITFRQKVSPDVAFGIKLSALLGIYYTNFSITNSSFYVDNDGTKADLSLQGKYTATYTDGNFSKKSLIGYTNPGVSVGFGVQAQLENGILLQGNIKDLGFIRWGKNTVTYNFNGSQNIDRLATNTKNDSRILTEADSIIYLTQSNHAFYAPVNGKADAAISKKFNVFTADFYYTPAFIVSKDLFYDGLTTAFVNHFNYKNLWFTALASYNDERIWNAGAQVMFKSPNAEIYIGTEQLFKSAHFFDTNNVAYHSTGINAFIGFSAKFGRLIEHPANASYIPMGEEKGFFNRIWRHVFKRPHNY